MVNLRKLPEKTARSLRHKVRNKYYLEVKKVAKLKSEKLFANQNQLKKVEIKGSVSDKKG